MTPPWLKIQRGEAPLVVSLPHTGTLIPPDLERRFSSPWLARKDCDWWIDLLYDFRHDLGATTLCTEISRSVIDVNRDPSGASLYPGQATTELCPTTTFDGEALYAGGETPDGVEIARRRAAYFEPYHGALQAELQRLKARHGRVVLYDAHAIRSRIPRLFDGELPVFNIGANQGASCDDALRDAAARVCAKSSFSSIVDGRFKGGWTIRHHGRPDQGVHAVQMELACRAYLQEPEAPTPQDWPPPFDLRCAEPVQRVLREVLEACLTFASSR